MLNIMIKSNNVLPLVTLKKKPKLAHAKLDTKLLKAKIMSVKLAQIPNVPTAVEKMMKTSVKCALKDMEYKQLIVCALNAPKDVVNVMANPKKFALNVKPAGSWSTINTVPQNVITAHLMTKMDALCANIIITEMPNTAPNAQIMLLFLELLVLMNA